MSRKPKTDKVEKEKTYQIRPQFKDKFRPSEAKEKIEAIVHEHLKDKSRQATEYPTITKEIADQCRKALKDLGKDKRYKFLVQCILGQNKGQGVRVGSR